MKAKNLINLIESLRYTKDTTDDDSDTRFEYNVSYSNGSPFGSFSFGNNALYCVFPRAKVVVQNNIKQYVQSLIELLNQGLKKLVTSKGNDVISLVGKENNYFNYMLDIDVKSLKDNNQFSVKQNDVIGDNLMKATVINIDGDPNVKKLALFNSKNIFAILDKEDIELLIDVLEKVKKDNTRIY